MRIKFVTVFTLQAEWSTWSTKGHREFPGEQNTKGFGARNTAMKCVVIRTLPKLKSTDKV